MPDLTSVSVEGLLDQFNHSFEFPAEWEFVILHGPNGIGKTKLLELINATLNANAFKLEAIPFRRAEFGFSDKSRLTIISDAGHHQAEEGEEELQAGHLNFELTQPDGTLVTSPGPIVSPGELRRARTIIDRELPLTRVELDNWLDIRSNNLITTQEVMVKYSDLFESRLGRPFSATWKDDNPIRQFLNSLSVHFIETQRLLAESRPRTDRYSDRTHRTRSTVEDLAEDLTSRIREALAQNSRTSQQLDRDFPRRIMLEHRNLPEATDDAIKRRYNEQSSLRQRLAEIALLDIQTDLPLPSRPLENWERRVLWTYLADSEKKLETFIPILERAALLIEIVNARFLFKEMKIDADQGFRFVTQSGKEIPPQVLSSGEQHELVLAYELLFQAKQESLVLIDEPEISLHIAWQKAFLNDIVRIAQVSSLRFIIATHSPQIINKWWARAVPLPPDYDEVVDD